MESPTQLYESFIASAYAAPIFELVQKLKGSRGTPNEVQASVFEYGHSASAIALTVLFLESFLNISKYLTGSHERSVRTYFVNTFPNSVYRDDVQELFTVRDVIAHNHVWSGLIDPVAMTWKTLELMPGYGDKAFQSVIHAPQRVTKKLRLNVVPTRLCFDDVRVVLTTTAAVLLELREWHSLQPVAHHIGPGGFGYVDYHGKPCTFLEAVSLIDQAEQ